MGIQLSHLMWPSKAALRLTAFIKAGWGRILQFRQAFRNCHHCKIQLPSTLQQAGLQPVMSSAPCCFHHAWLGQHPEERGCLGQGIAATAGRACGLGEQGLGLIGYPIMQNQMQKKWTMKWKLQGCRNMTPVVQTQMEQIGNEMESCV